MELSAMSDLYLSLVSSHDSPQSAVSHSYSSTPTQGLLLDDSSSFLKTHPHCDIASNQSPSLTDSGLDDSPYLYYRFGTSSRSHYNNERPRSTANSVVSSVPKMAPSENNVSPSLDGMDIPLSNSNSQWTPEMRPVETRKRLLRKTYEDLFPDSGLSEIRCSSPTSGCRPPSPKFSIFTMKELISSSPFVEVSSALQSPAFGSSPDDQFGPGNDLYFTSSSLKHCALAALINSEAQFGVDAVAIKDLPTDVSSPVSCDRESSLCVNKQKPSLGRSLSLSDFECNIDGTRRNLFNCSADKSSGSLTSLPVGTEEAVQKPVKRQRKKTECESDQIERIGSAINRATEEDLIGDFTRPFCLPRCVGKHHDLKSISSETLYDLCNGKYCEVISRYCIVDCRYPYEYQGGHILGAKNIYSKEQLLNEYFNKEDDDSNQRVVIFHCEFSSERAPKLMRLMRSHDRIVNADRYPSLRYPEIYLLEGGYQAFHSLYGSACSPSHGYTPMCHRDHSADLRTFKTQLKSTEADAKKSRATWKATGRLFR